MTQTLATVTECHIAGKVYELPDAMGASWIRAGLAVRSAVPPDWIMQITDRLDDHGKPCLFLPPAGVEFGHECMTCIRIVHFNRAKRKVVCCRPGTEVLYPSADEYVTDWTDPTNDTERCGTYRDRAPLQWPGLLARFPDHHPVSVSGFSLSQEMFPIEPDQRIPFRPKPRGLYADVALGVRVRESPAARNWPRENWTRVTDALTSAGLTYAVVGRHETSMSLPGQQFHTGDYDTDAAVELLQSCRLFVGSCSGAAHLASAVGSRMLIFRLDDSNRKFIDRMEVTNKGRVTFLPTGWEDAGEVARQAAALASSMVEVTTLADAHPVFVDGKPPEPTEAMA